LRLCQSNASHKGLPSDDRDDTQGLSKAMIQSGVWGHRSVWTTEKLERIEKALGILPK
jgi:hypothetical protein